MANTRRQQRIAAESSWRMVEGSENDSFDTPIVRGGDDLLLEAEGEEDVLSSGSDPSQLSQLSHFSGSQPFSIGGGGGPGGGSQDDSIENFLLKAERGEGDKALLRTPFKPSVPQAVRDRSRETMHHQPQHQYQRQYQYQYQQQHGPSPPPSSFEPEEPEFYMPTVEVDRHDARMGMGAASSPSSRSSATVRAGTGLGVDLGLGLRQRQPLRVVNTVVKKGRPRGKVAMASGGGGGRGTIRRGSSMGDEGEEEGGGYGLVDSLLGALYDIIAWVLGLVGLALRYAQKPLAIALAVYFTFGALIMVQNMATKSLYASLSPICRLPGASWLDLPFCPAIVPRSDDEQQQQQQSSKAAPVEFDGLVDVQEQFEQVLEKSAQGVSLPMEMKRSEAAVRDLRTMVRYSDLQSRDELVLEFDGFIETARAASSDLQRFNTHVGSAVDAVISINRWTSRYLDGLAAEQQQQFGGEDGGGGGIGGGIARWAGAWAGWAFAPFQPAGFSERALLDQYVEHASLVGERIARLIVEAQAVLRQLGRAEDHLGIVYELATRTQRAVQGRRDDMLWTLWTLVGGNARQLHGLEGQLALLRRVDAQRSSAVRQLSELVVELERIQAGLSDLRDRVAEPGIARASGTLRAEIPLSVHVETIDRGVDRLEMARSRIRAVEDERIREVLARGAGAEERLIESS